MSDSDERPTRPGMAGHTRRGNANKHPGLQLGVKQKRRTPAEMAAYREAQQREKASKAAKKTTDIKTVAELENRARKNVNKTNQERNHPGDRLTIPRSTRVREEVSRDAGQ